MKVRVLYHDNCFDGAASAAFFTRFLQDKFYPEAEFHYSGLAHKASDLFENNCFDGDVNAIVDFKYSPDPRLTWWFDHHQSAFLRPEDEDHFHRQSSRRKMFDPSFRSCTQFIATKTKELYGYEARDLQELVEWAEIIDGALYENAQAAVEMAAPAMKLVLVIENARGTGMVQRIIQLMCRHTLSQIAGDPEVRALFEPLYQRHLESIGAIRERSRCQGGVVYFDLSDSDLEGYNKFIPYYLFPDSLYTVSVSLSSFRTKVSVGSNPWARRPLNHNLATICERYGGGGHARVGAISFEKGDTDRALAAAREIVQELQL